MAIMRLFTRKALLINQCSKKMIKNLLFALLLVSCAGSSRESVELSQEQAESRLATLCADITNFDQLSKMQELIDMLRFVPSHKNYAEYQRKTSWSFLGWESRAVGCVHQAASIKDLEPIIKERQDVCSPKHIDLIFEYKRRYIDTKLATLTKKFFKVYAYQVSTICKENMLRSLVEAEKSFASEDFEKVMPWINSEFACKRSYSGDNESVSSENDPEEQLCCKALDVFTSLTSINDLAIALQDDRRLGLEETGTLDLSAWMSLPKEDSRRVTDGNAPPTNENDPANGIKKNQLYFLSQEGLQPKLDDLVHTCSKLEKIYSRVITPIVRLTSEGYDLVNKKFDKKCSEEQGIHRWLSVTLVCTSILNLYSDKPTDETEALPSISRAYSRTDHDTVEESEAAQTPVCTQNPIQDKLRVAKHIPGPLSVFGSKFVNNIVNLLESNQTIKRIMRSDKWKKGGSLVAKIVLVMVALLSWQYT